MTPEGYEYGRGYYISPQASDNIIVLSSPHFGGTIRFALHFKLDGIGGTIAHMRNRWTNAWDRWANYDCCPYENCFDTMKEADLEIWQTPCGEVVFEYPGFYHKFEARHFLEGQWNVAIIDQWTSLDTTVTPNRALPWEINTSVWLNDEKYSAHNTENWVISPYSEDDDDSEDMKAIGGYILSSTYGSFEDTTKKYVATHKAAGYYSFIAWDNDYEATR